jgi:hypothetical protein
MIRINSPFTLESILLSLSEDYDKRVNITYLDNSNMSGFITQEYKEDGKLHYLIFDKDNLLYHFIELDKVRTIDI